MPKTNVISKSHPRHGDVPAIRSDKAVSFMGGSNICPMEHLLIEEGSSLSRARTQSADKRKQTTSTAPVIAINDLTQKPGDEVEIEYEQTAVGVPVIGMDKSPYGTGVELKNAVRKIGIDKTAYEINLGPGEEHTRQYNGPNYDINGRALATMVEWFRDIRYERWLTQLAGSRGHYMGPQTQLPISGHKLNELLVNPLYPISANYRLTAGQLKGRSGSNLEKLDGMQASDRFDYELLEKLVFFIEQMDYAPNHIKHKHFPGIRGVLIVMPGQWQDLLLDQRFQNLHSNSSPREDIAKHPLFNNDARVIRSVLVVPSYDFRIRFHAGAPVETSINPSIRETTAIEKLGASSSFHAERAVYVGGSALGYAMGVAQKGMRWNIHFERFPDSKLLENTAQGRMTDGSQRLQFEEQNGVLKENVVVLDTAAPPGVSIARSNHVVDAAATKAAQAS